MSLDLSLYTIEDDLLSLLEMREQASAEIDGLSCVPVVSEQTMERLAELEAEQKAIDGQLIEYAKAEVRKADGIGHHWRNFETRIAAKKAEAKRLTGEAALDQARLNRLKGMVQFVMESFEWRSSGKPRVIEGKTCKLYLKANGGKQAVEVTDESLVPDELCTVTVTMSAALWKTILSMNYFIPGTFKESRTPSLSLIGEALGKPCGVCAGDPNSIFANPCPECGGSGHQSVPGCRLVERGSHVECR